MKSLVLLLEVSCLATVLAAPQPSRGQEPSIWEIFNETDPGTEYWEEQRRLHSNESSLLYLHNDIDVPENYERQGVKGMEWRWPDGVIPVYIDPWWSTSVRQNIIKGMEYLMSLTCIRFVDYDPAKHPRFVRVEPGPEGFGCRALIGRWNEPEGQWVKLEPTWYCVKPETVAHEFVHTIGFWHEQQRPDRDDYITILYDNIPQERWTDFEKKSDLGTYGTPYDYNSIMHYPANAVAIDESRPTIVSKTRTPVPMQPEDHLSPLDAQKINNMYRGICK